MRFTSLVSLLVLSACTSKWEPVDLDGDGYTIATGDCWESDVDAEGIASADIHPGASETWYDGFDQDCDGGSDYDKDGDGHASVDFPDPDGVLPSDDCWDDPDVIPPNFEALDPGDQLDASAVFPGAAEIWYDGIDADCGGDDDFDQDGDGYASAEHAGPDGAGEDCFDADDDSFENGGGLAPEDVNPDASETWYDNSDQDCAGDDDFDQDGDGFARDLECDDTDASRYPNPDIPEVWYDGIDDNCDGNDGDQDGDGYYAADYPYTVPAAFGEGDCWDDAAAGGDWNPINGFDPLSPADAHPAADETWYDGVDQNCDGADDFDQDVDGYRTNTWPDTLGAIGDDCDDASGEVYPGAVDDWYDGIDADCAGNDDFDQDSDGYANDTDCDDSDLSVNPGALETCGNTVDEDCSGSSNDEGASGCTDFYADSDGDGYGASTATCLCEAEGVYTETSAGDCDDGSAAVNPGAAESCLTTEDDNCDGSTNSVGAAGCTDFYVDSDGDTYGAGAAQCQCESSGSYTADNADDCDDTSGTVYPGRTETCNDIDDDCDGTPDDGLTLYYDDDDADGYGAGTGDCATGGGRVANADDCDDTSDLAYPGATELCDGIANDCDTSSSWTSADEDGLVFQVSSGGVWTDISSSFTSASTYTLGLESGYTYYFCAGTYDAKIVGSSDTADVIGVYGADYTSLDISAAAGSVVSVTNGSVTVSGFTITGGHGAGSSPNIYGGGAIAAGSGSLPSAPILTLEDCIVTGNTANYGGGVSSYTLGWVELVGTTVDGNTAAFDGGGVHAKSTALVTMDDSTVSDNTSDVDGGGIYLDDGVLTMTGSYVINNTATDDAGGIFIDTGTATCSSGGIYGNTSADNGGGVYLSNHSTTLASFTATSCDFGSGASDNSPNDVTIKTGGSTYVDYASYSSAASFVCNSTSDICTP